jgi:hypothetical protein
MIREAHCGLGIGIEPTADTKAFSDRQVQPASLAKSSEAHWLRFHISLD